MASSGPSRVRQFPVQVGLIWIVYEAKDERNTLGRKAGRLAINYGGADTITTLAFTYLEEVVNFVKRTSEV